MRKKLTLILVLIFAVFSLFACHPVGERATLGDLKDAEENIGSKDDVLTGGGEKKDITVYLVLGAGHTVQGKAGESIAELSLENAIKVVAKADTELPKADITETLAFVGWSFAKDALANPILKMPKVDNSVLYAIWSLVGSGGSEPQPPITNNTDFYLAFDGTLNEETQFQINSSPIVPGSKEFYLTRTFTLDETFTFVSKKAMQGITKGDECVYPTSNNRGFTLNWDTKKNIKTNEFFMPTDINQVNPSNEYYSASVSTSKLKCIKAGSYTLYVTVYDNGWVAIFAEPN